MDDDFLGFLIFCALIGGAVCSFIAVIIADKKNLRTGPAFLLGLVFGIIGVIIIAVTKSNPDPAPKGMKSVVCVTCNARQNIPADDQIHECWQCKRQLEPSL